MFREWMLAAAAAVSVGFAAQAAPLEVYGKLPSIEQAEISPSGNLIAFVATDGESRNIIVQTTSDRATVVVAPLGAAKIRNVTWAGDQHLIISFSTAHKSTDVSGPRVERMMAQDLNLTTKRMRNLLTAPKGGEEAMNVLLGAPEVRTIDGRTIVFVRGVHFVGGNGQVGLFRIDIDRGDVALAKPGDGDVRDWLLGKDGQVVAQEYYRSAGSVWTLKVRTQAGDWKTIDKVTAPIDIPEIVGLSADSRAVIVAFPQEDGYVWRQVSLETGAWSDSANDEASSGAVIASGEARVIARHRWAGDATEYIFFDPHDAAVWRGIVKAFPGDTVSLASWSDDRKKIVVLVDSADQGPAYSLVDLGTGSATWLEAEYAGIKEGDLSPRKSIRYKAADGLEISGYLTLPRGKDAKNLPLVVLAHGGPQSRDGPGFDWWAQAIASRGYAVLQPNFRGSSGYGHEFVAAGFGEVGRKMQTDLSDGVRDLVRQGLVDPKRVCIVGASYGGYAALAGATLDRGVYRCAVSYAGMSDLPLDIRDSKDKGGVSAQRYWLRFLGAKDLNDPVLKAVSPAYHANDVTIPLLLIHGQDDTRVVFRQSQRMADEMRRAGKPVELVALKGEDHFLSSGATRLQMLQSSMDFLEKHNPPN